MTLSKKCKNCGDVFLKKPTDSLRSWNTRTKFCSKSCFDIFRRGKPSPSPATTFKKGQHVPVPLESRRRGPDNSKWRGGPVSLPCLICNTFFTVEHCQAKRGAKTCSRTCANEFRRTPLMRERMSVVHRKRVADGLHNCYCGAGNILDLIRDTVEYREWRTNVFQRDNYTCKACGQHGGRFNLNADHIKPFALIVIENNIVSFQDAKACEELWDIKNGRTLCVECHRKTPTYGTRLKLPSFASHIIPDAVLWYPNAETSMIEKSNIENSISIVTEAMNRRGIFVNLKINDMPSRNEESDFVQLVSISARIIFGDILKDFDFWAVVPVPTHRRVENWAWIISHNLTGKAFDQLNNKVAPKIRIGFWEKAREAVNELNRKAHENVVNRRAIPAVFTVPQNGGGV